MGLFARYLEAAGVATIEMGAVPRILHIVQFPHVYRVQAALGQLVDPSHDRTTQRVRIMVVLSLVAES